MIKILLPEELTKETKEKYKFDHSKREDALKEIRSSIEQQVSRCAKEMYRIRALSDQILNEKFEKSAKSGLGKILGPVVGKVKESDYENCYANLYNYYVRPVILNPESKPNPDRGRPFFSKAGVMDFDGLPQKTQDAYILVEWKSDGSIGCELGVVVAWYNVNLEQQKQGIQAFPLIVRRYTMGVGWTNFDFVKQLANLDKLLEDNKMTKRKIRLF